MKYIFLLLFCGSVKAQEFKPVDSKHVRTIDIRTTNLWDSIAILNAQIERLTKFNNYNQKLAILEYDIIMDFDSREVPKEKLIYDLKTLAALLNAKP